MKHNNNDNKTGTGLTVLFHDIKNLLNNIAIATALIETELREQEESKKYIEEIKLNYERIKQMLNNYIPEDESVLCE